MTVQDYNRIKAFRQLKKEIRGSKDYLIVGVDIGKLIHHAFLGNAMGNKFLNLKIENNASGFEHLLTADSCSIL
jgi:ribosome-binding ATPase YchF (GTP1/OBG family)